MNSKGIYIGAVAICKMPIKEVTSRLKHCPKCDIRLATNFCSQCGTKMSIVTEARVSNIWDFVSEDSSYYEKLYELPVANMNKIGIRYYVGNYYLGDTDDRGQVDTESPTEVTNLPGKIIAFQYKYGDVLKYLAAQGIKYEVKFMVIPWWEY